MRLILVCLCLGLGLHTQSALGASRRVQTIDGQFFEGEVRFTNNLLVVNGTNQVPLEQLSELLASLPSTNIFSAGNGQGLLGYYFGRTNFEGTVTVRLDEAIDFDWASSAPLQGVPAERFSVIWSGDIEPPVTGEYRFTVIADDHARLSISNEVVIASGSGERGKEVTSPARPMQGGVKYPLELAFANSSGPAAIKLLWTGPGFGSAMLPKERLHPRSTLSRHPSGSLAAQGVLATYYKNPDFSGETFTRVDPRVDFSWTEQDPLPGFSRNRHGVRWQGQIRADYSETYTFHVLSDEPVRLWVDGRPLILPGGQYYMTEVKESLPLLAGERYDIRLEAQSTGSGATTKLMWSSASIPKTVVPETNLFPSVLATPAGVPLERSGRYPRGVLLRGGSFVGIPVERATESSIRCGRWLKNNSISTVNASRIFCQPVSKAMVDRIPANRRGLLLSNGDFVDGELKSLDYQQVRIGSVLFGTKTYSAGREVLVVVLNEVEPVEGPFTVRLRDQSVLQMDIPDIDASGATMRAGAVGRIRMPWEEVIEIKRVAPGRASR